MCAIMGYTGTDIPVTRLEEGFAAARFSKACRERLDSLTARGYRFRRAAVRFIVAWKDTEEDKEWAVLLADLELEKEAVGH